MTKRDIMRERCARKMRARARFVEVFANFVRCNIMPNFFSSYEVYNSPDQGIAAAVLNVYLWPKHVRRNRARLERIVRAALHEHSLDNGFCSYVPNVILLPCNTLHSKCKFKLHFSIGLKEAK